MEIELASFPAPWSKTMFMLEMSNRGNVSIAVELDGDLCAYAVCTRHADVWHLLNFAVDPPQRRTGLGALLMQALIDRIGDKVPMTLEVRPSNESALALYASFDFLVAGRRPGYYADNGEDGLIMWRTEHTASGSFEGIPDPDLGAA
jgi:ribosomal-protein-alanine N-acetyltransferase